MECLKRVNEPVLNENIISLGLVHEIEVDKARVFLHMENASSDPGVRNELTEKIKSVLGEAGASHVEIHFSGKPKCGMGGQEAEPLSGVKHVIAVSSGKGGVGKSTAAVNLALALKKLGARTGLMDGDIYGPNIPIMLGIPSDRRTEPGGSGKILPIEAHGIRAVSIGFFANPEQPMIWRGPLLHKTVQEFLHRVEWGELDFLVVDLPPGTGDVQLSLAQWVRVSGAVIVTTPQEVALADVRRAINMFRQLEIPVLGVVENMTGPVFGRGGGERVAKDFQVPFLGDIPLDAEIRECGDAGVPIVAATAGSGTSERFIKIAEAIRQAFYKNDNPSKTRS